MKVGVFFRMSNPPPWERDWHRLYDEVLEQVTWAETLGFDSVASTEHHFTRDGYVPDPLTVLAAFAARTTRVELCTWILLLPLYHPLRVAESAALVDVLSGGRLSLGMALGYRWEEFQAFGVPRSLSGQIADEALEVVVRALVEEQFSFEGRFFKMTNVTLAPKGYRKPRPRIWVGHPSNAAGVRRVAKWGLDGFAGLPAPEIHEKYLDYCTQFGTAPQAETQALIQGHCGEDSELVWTEAKRYAQWSWASYREWWWTYGDTRIMSHSLRDDPLFRFGDEDVWLDRVRPMAEHEPPLDHLLVGLQLPGMPHEMVMRSMEYFAKSILPRLHAM